MSISGKLDPVVRKIRVADIAEALGQGLRDFQAVPLYGLMFGAVYMIGGNAILLCLTALGMVYLAYPLAAGFSLIGRSCNCSKVSFTPSPAGSIS